MKTFKHLSAVLFCLVASTAFAQFKPSQIEDALAAKDYSSARSMVDSVMTQHPDSARAHLLKAYLLVHVDHNGTAARTELDTAKNLDKKGDVIHSALFGRVVSEMDIQKATSDRSSSFRPAPEVTPATVPAADSHKGGISSLIPFILGLLVLAAVFAAVIAIFRRLTGSGGGHTTVINQSGGYPGGYADPAGSPMPNHYGYGYGPAPVQSGQGMGMMGTAASVAGGVVAGELIHDALTRHHNNGSGSYNDDQGSGRQFSGQPNGQFANNTPDYNQITDRMDHSSSAASYDEERASFASSTTDDDDWRRNASYGADSDSSSSSDGGGSSGSSDWD